MNICLAAAKSLRLKILLFLNKKNVFFLFVLVKLTVNFHKLHKDSTFSTQSKPFLSHCSSSFCPKTYTCTLHHTLTNDLFLHFFPTLSALFIPCRFTGMTLQFLLMSGCVNIYIRTRIILCWKCDF